MTHRREMSDTSIFDGPTHDDRALVLTFRYREDVPAAAERYRKNRVKTVNAVARVSEYAARTGAALEPLFPASAADWKDEPWKSQARSQAGDLPMSYHLELTSPDDVAELEKDLRSDPWIASAHRPAIFYPLPVHRNEPGSRTGAQWALHACGFRKEIWDRLEKGGDPGVIGMIDAGGKTSHFDLEGRIDYVPPGSGTGAPSIHGAEVAAVIAAIRGNGEEVGRGMAGCCSAMVRVYDTWHADRFDSKAFYRALETVGTDKLPVLNLSMGSFTSDALVHQLIRRCMERGVVVVAAMGDFAACGSPPVFPAAQCDVVAVGGTSRSHEKTITSSTGCHIWISAPGEDILTVSGDEEVVEADGTSYATAIVSAAVWLARRADPSLSPAAIRDVLAKSVDGVSVPNGGHSVELGYGRLDMAKLADIVAPPRP